MPVVINADIFILVAIRLAYKKSQNNQNPIEDAQEELDTVEQLLAAAGV